MKRLLIIALAIAPGLPGTFDARVSFYSPVEKTVVTRTHAPKVKDNSSLSREEADAKRIAEETKDSAAASRLYDTVMPPLCLLMLAWLNLSLQGSKQKSP